MAEVIPAINCHDLECVTKRLHALERFLPEGAWVHLDVADSRFTFNKTWGDPFLWTKLKVKFSLEVHLMAEEPERLVEDWLAAGAKRIVVHFETLFDPNLRVIPADGHSVLDEIRAACEKAGAELMVSSNPETSAQHLKKCFGKVDKFQVLAVHPGFAAQPFLPLMLEKIKFLRRELPEAKIEVDGGINAETGKRAREAGADILVAASYLFGNRDPKSAYKTLKSL